MTDTPLDYDKIIWTVFSVGVISSVVILYHFYNPQEFQILALSLGFAVLVYSFFLILGYGWKKKCSMKMPNNIALKNEIDSKNYVRTRWIGELILVVIGGIYFYAFGCKWIWVPLTILIFFSLLCIIANWCAKKK